MRRIHADMLILHPRKDFLLMAISESYLMPAIRRLSGRAKTINKIPAMAGKIKIYR